MVTIGYIGHSAFNVTSDGVSLLVDPYITGNPAATSTPGEFSPSTILLTHAHNDHVGDTVAIAARTGAAVIATAELAGYLGGKGVKNAVAANHGGTVRFEGGSTKFVPAWHTSSYFDDELQTNVAPGVPAGHVVRVGGKTIYFAGDTCLFGDMRLIGDEGLDVAVIPIGDHFTMGPADAVRAVEFLRPRIVIPCHYNTFPPIRQDGAAFKETVEAKTGALCVVLEPGESFDVD